MTSPTPQKTINIFQFWDQPEPPVEVKKIIRTWRQHDGFKLRLFDDIKAKEFILKNFDKRTYDAFCKCAIPAMKADFFRYCALYVKGGLYTDIDIALKPKGITDLRDLINSVGAGFLMRRHRAIANDFIFIRRAKHPLLEKVIEKAIYNIENETSNSVWHVTGPGIMTKFFRNTGSKERKLINRFKLLSHQDIGKIVKFKWKLEYKEGATHWTKAQEEKSIFVNGIKPFESFKNEEGKIGNRVKHSQKKKNKKAQKALKSVKVMKPNQDYKVFCIGFNETGTSNIHAFFKDIGRKSLHNLAWAEMSNYVDEDILKAFINDYDCFSGGEMPDVIKLDKNFPKSKYILSVIDLKQWLESRVKWVYRKFPNESTGPMAREYFADSKKAIKTWVERRQSFHNWVLNYFKDRPQDLLIVNVYRDKYWGKKIMEFLNSDQTFKEEIPTNKMQPAIKPAKQKVLNEKFAELESVLLEMGVAEEFWQNEIVVQKISNVEKPLDLRLDMSRMTKKWIDKYSQTTV